MAQPEPPGLLYHYTDSGGLKGILENLCIWATDVQFLNDAQELQFGRNELYEALGEYAKEIAPEGTPEGSAECSRAAIVMGARSYIEEGNSAQLSGYFSPYVACFCEEGDLLSQWRGYASGGGYAIGFKSEALRQVALIDPRTGNQAPSMMGSEVNLIRVTYGPDAISEMVSSVIGKIAPRPQAHSGVHGHYQAGTVVIPALARIKHEAFREEREWRLLTAPESAVAEFRTSGLGLVPYLTLKIDSAAIQEVVVGPGSHMNLRLEGVRRLLKKLELSRVVRRSEAPFRG